MFAVVLVLLGVYSSDLYSVGSPTADRSSLLDKVYLIAGLVLAPGAVPAAFLGAWRSRSARGVSFAAGVAGPVTITAALVAFAGGGSLGRGLAVLLAVLAGAVVGASLAARMRSRDA